MGYSAVDTSQNMQHALITDIISNFSFDFKAEQGFQHTHRIAKDRLQ